MKSILFTISMLLFSLTAALSQQTQRTAEQQLVHDKKADTAVANHDVRNISKYTTLDSTKQKAIVDASIRVNQTKRQVYKQYWKTETFKTEIAKVEHLKDSLYASILGTKAYELIKEKQIRDQQKRLLEIQAKAKAIKDSTTSKP